MATSPLPLPVSPLRNVYTLSKCLFSEQEYFKAELAEF